MRNNIDYDAIDSGIREIVYLLNERVPFTTTGPMHFGGSCQGHLTKRLGITEIVADPGCCFIHEGDLLFKVDTTHLSSGAFLKEVYSLRDKYSFVDVGEHHCGELECSIEGWQSIALGAADIIHDETIKESDPIEVQLKKRRQVTEEDGLQRLREYQQVWNDFLEIVKRYLE